MNIPEIAKCPFCGTDHVKVDINCAMIRCQKCLATGPQIVGGDFTSAWNRRQPTPEAAEKCKLCDDKGRYSVDVYDKDAKAWMPEWRICECRAHPPKPETTEALMGVNQEQHDAAMQKMGELAASAPKPTAEWMEALESLADEWISDSEDEASCPTHQSRGPIECAEDLRTFIKQHAPKEENK